MYANKLALLNGKPVRNPNSWPRWPISSPELSVALDQVLESQRWAVRARWTGHRAQERIFSDEFAKFNQVKYCVCTPNGTSALRLALEALDVGAGDEVIMPGLTWVATAIAALDVNATPVFVDVDPETYCLDPDAIRGAITPRTKCILPVHFHSSMADMDAIMEIGNEKGLWVLEDSAQAHGARWSGKYAGSIGHVGAFSMHNDKLLTSGEGGAIITNDEKIYRRLQALRLDGFDFYETPSNTIEGMYELAEVSDVMGSSCSLSEFQAAILLVQLRILDKQNFKRQENATYLKQLLSQIAGISPVKRPDQLELQTFYEFSITYSGEHFSNCTIYAVCRAVSKELGFPVYPENLPLHKNPLYKPLTKKRYHFPGYENRLDTSNYYLPISERASDELMLFPHWVLLGEQKDMDDIATAFDKVLKNSDELRKIQEQVDELVGYTPQLGL